MLKYILAILLVSSVAWTQEDTIEEKDVASQAVQATGGKYVRIVGAQRSPFDAVVDNAQLGRVVIIAAMPENALCHVLLDAPAIGMNVFYLNSELAGEVPNIPELKDYFGKASWPVKLPGSCNQQDYCIWSALFKGQGCIVATDLSEYVGSTMKEFLALTPVDKGRSLVARGTCTIHVGGRDVEVSCAVPFAHPNAETDSPLWVPHGWAGRKDLNFVRAVDGQPEPRYVLPE
jgi:hypothetical protein